MVALLDALAISQPVALIGLSMGGYVALAVARKHPQRLRALVLADTRAEADDEQAKANRDKMITFARSHTASDVLEQLLPKLLAAQTREQRSEIVEEIRRMARDQSIEGIIGALKVMRERPDASDSLASIRIPTLVLVGAEDAVTPPALAEKLAAGIAGTQLVKIPNAGHLSNLEQPAAFNEALLKFF